MRQQKKIYLFLGLIIIITVSISIYVHNQPEKITQYTNYTECDHTRFASPSIKPSTFLNDKNDLHLLVAEKNGLKEPFESDSTFLSQVPDLVRKATLVEVRDNCFYKLKNLSHSQPYLIPEAVDMLNEIGYRFQDLLKKKKYHEYRFMITSMLRTQKAQTQLSHRNSNATIHSSHLYGTTVDISYKNFYNMQTDSIESSYEAVQTLTAVLREMREECKFVVVRERKQSCFHITVVVCRPI